jgi:hypothetical protein
LDAFDARREHELRGVHVERDELLGVFERDAAIFAACATLTLLKSAKCSVAEYMVSSFGREWGPPWRPLLQILRCRLPVPSLPVG